MQTFQRLTLLMVACLALSLNSLTIFAQDSRETLTVAFVGASSGSRATADRELYAAANLAAAEINALTGDDELVDADGTSYRLDVVYYEANTAPDTVTAYEDALDDDAVIVLVAPNSSALAALDDAGVISAAVLHAAPDGVSGGGFFRLVADYTTQAQAMADYLVNQRQVTNIAIAVADTATAQDARSAFVAAADNADVELVADTNHEADADADDLANDAEEIRESDADALFLWTLDAQAAILLEALDQEGWDGLVLYHSLSANFINRADTFADGVIAPATWLANAYDAQSQVFSSAYQAEYAEAPQSNAAAYYDALYMLANAVREVGSESAAIRTELGTQGVYDGVQALYTNAQSNDLLLVIRVGDNTLEQVRYVAGECVNCPNLWRADLANDVAEERDSFLIGLVLPTDGTAEVLGVSLENAVDMAVREINDQGGVLGADNIQYALALRTYHAANAMEAAAALQQASQDGVKVLLGFDFNAQVLDNLGLLAQFPVPHLVSATDARIPNRERSDRVLQIRSNDAAIAATAVRYLIEEQSLTNLATIALRADYAREAQSAAERAIRNSDDGRLALSTTYELGKLDADAMVQQIITSDADAVLLWSHTVDALALLAALEANAWTGTLVYPYAPLELIDFASNTITVLTASNWSASAQDWLSQQFTADYIRTYGATPVAQAAAYYDAIYWLADGMTAVGAEPLELNTWLLDTDVFRGVQGVYAPVTYGAGETIRSVFIGHVHADGTSELARYDGDTCLVGCDE